MFARFLAPVDRFAEPSVVPLAAELVEDAFDRPTMDLWRRASRGSKNICVAFENPS